MTKRFRSSLCLAACVLAACSQQNPDSATAVPAEAAPSEPTADETSTDAAPSTDALTRAIEGEHRSAENKARDPHRHPAETLAFFGVEPGDTVVELWPGGGWYTEILAPYLKDQGTLYVTIADPAGPEAYYGTRQAKAMQEKIADASGVFSAVKTVQVPMDVKMEKDQVKAVTVKPFELLPEGTADVVLTFRNSHGWYNSDAQEMIYAAAFKALKPGGTFGVVQHRADEGSDPKETAKKGYLPESAVIAAAQAVGFELAEKSEINANPKDTKDYEKGVWTLPPGLALGEQDKQKYLDIGESDRMTLKFVKPQA